MKGSLMSNTCMFLTCLDIHETSQSANFQQDEGQELLAVVVVATAYY
jgi:hypothetical protein